MVGKTERPERRSISPDPEIFEKTRFKADWLKSRLHETAYLNPKLTILYENKRAGEAEKGDLFGRTASWRMCAS
ncbi:MAG: hypothetical protein ACLR8P_06880 [Clostridium fessum]